MVCQKVSYLDALSLDISGGGEVVDKPLFSDTCHSSNVTVLEFFSVPIPTTLTVASPKAISCSSPECALFCVVWPPSVFKFFFLYSPHWVPKKFGNLGKKNFVFPAQIHPLLVFVLPCLPSSSWVVQILNLPNRCQNFWHNP